jgi:hypothetical protein
MNDFYKGVILSLLTKALTGVSTYMVTMGWLSQDQTTQLVLGVAGLVASVIMSVWQRYGSALIKNAALQLPQGATLEDAKRLAKTDAVAPATIPTDVAPKPVTSPSSVKTNVVSGLMLVLAASIGLSACTSNPTPNGSPERTVAQYGIQAGTYLAEVKTSADELYAKQLLPEPAYRKVLEALVKVNGEGERLGAALKAYDAAITDADRNSVVAQIDAALLSLQAALPTVVPQGLPLDVAQRIGKGVVEVQRLLITIARFTAPEGAYLRSIEPALAA